MPAETPTKDEKDLIRRALVVNYKEIFERLLDRVKRVVVLDERGNAHIVGPREKLTDSQMIALYLVARQFAHTIGMAQADTMSTEELSKVTGISYKTLTARVSGLRRQGWIESDARGKYRVVYTALEEILADVEGKLGAGMHG